ncbi:hypothetical protein JS510_00650 [Mycoplasma tauri]|uniref:Mbov_0396 family ICE element transmembrane protein n=1 Tax=Mycoplasma tauri TaxID=547987 RepID=UPI00196767C9|nr:hypothetical protein [Mycoplasma tauri]QSB07625.1 hypothetical protein JS510_00650 [Mycoplasma tauri]
MTSFFTYLFDIFRYGPAYVFWILLVLLAWLLFTILCVVFYIVDFCAFRLLNFVLFGLSPGQSIMEVKGPEPFYRFMIVSSIIWIIMFGILFIKFSFSESVESVKIIRKALVFSVKSALILLVFQLSLVLLSTVVDNLTKLVSGNNQNFGVNLSNSIFDMSYPPEAKGKQNLLVDGGSIIPILNGNATSFTSFASIAKIVGKSNAILQGILVCIGAILIAFPLTFAGFDAIGKVFPTFFLYVIFPFILPLSLLDDGKKVRVWKDKYVSNMMSLGIFLIGLQIMGIFFSLVNQFVMKSLSTQIWIAEALVMIIIFGATAMKFKEIAEIVTALFGTSVNSGNTAKGIGGAAKRAEAIGEKRASIKQNGWKGLFMRAKA